MEHKHHGKSSEKFLDSHEILSELNLAGSETFMDAGCGDGYISKKAIEEFLPEGKVYAVDVYDEAIAELDEYKEKNHISNLISICADLACEIPDVNDESVDVILMINVFHGFKASDEMDEVVLNLRKLLKNGGKFAIVEFKPIEMQFGPPLEIRCSHAELENLFEKHGFRKVHLNVEIGEDVAEGKSHFMIIFEKE